MTTASCITSGTVSGGDSTRPGGLARARLAQGRVDPMSAARMVV
jgi:hypothetical protein